ncbi:MAG: peptide/nickel transport system ATP-binding protein ddpF, partial [Gammaproteobacteria bacterium]|nr:peptide/nickel transport system ATP-binding protein ddpF [Gammaproteobacteria bacterium]
MTAPIVVTGLGIVTAGGQRVVEDASLTVAAGEILGIVGESGSGKTTLGLALLHHCRRGLRVGAGSIRINDRDLHAESAEGLRQLRGRVVCYVPQDPATALNPALRIGTQLRECLEPADATQDRLLELLAAVKLPAKPAFLQAFPHQLSGGQLQRVSIAMAFANRPRLIIMDEPTTGLDVTTQAHVLNTVRQMCAEHGVAALYVSHDIAVVASIAQRVAVIYAGRIVEIGPTERVLKNPVHPYTRALIRAVPDIDDDRPVSGIRGRAPERGAGAERCSFAPRCALAIDACLDGVPALDTVAPHHDVRCLRPDIREHADSAAPVVHDPRGQRPMLLGVDGLRAFYGRVPVLHGVTFELRAGECVGLVGESGSGKTTLARCIAGLHPEAEGQMTFRDAALPLDARHRTASMRQRVQYIFQNPYGSFNPRRSIGASLAVALGQFGGATRVEQRRKILATLDQVSLPASVVDRYPRELSGGQRQRAAIARALIVDPALLVCDEITSALDVSVQAVITELLCKLQRERGLSLLFVTHNLAVVRGIAQRIFVMQTGRLVEAGDTDDIMRRP